MQGIYKIVNKVNQKYYVGSTQDIEGRWKGHCCKLRKGSHSNIHLQGAWNKYGAESFTLEIVEIVEDRDMLLKREQAYLDEGFDFNELYNIALDALAPMRGKEAWNKGKTGVLTQETIDNISASLIEYYKVNDGYWKGKKMPKSVRQLQSESHRGQIPWNKGIPQSEEARRKNSEAHKGKKHTAETIQKRKISAARYYETHDRPMKGRHHTKETRRQISDTLSKSYPAFYNKKTGDFICPGNNLMRLCEARALNISTMRNLRNGTTQCSLEGWMVAIGDEDGP